MDKNFAESLIRNANIAIMNGGGDQFYSIAANNYLINNFVPARPLEENFWPNELKNLLEKKRYQWPNVTESVYLASVNYLPFIRYDWLRFGYALIDGHLKKTAFFVNESGNAIDPIAFYSGYNPELYFGANITRANTESGCNSLEDLVQKRLKKNTHRPCYRPFIEFSY